MCHLEDTAESETLGAEHYCYFSGIFSEVLKEFRDGGCTCLVATSRFSRLELQLCNGRTHIHLTVCHCATDRMRDKGAEASRHRLPLSIICNARLRETDD